MAERSSVIVKGYKDPAPAETSKTPSPHGAGFCPDHGQLLPNKERGADQTGIRKQSASEVPSNLP